MVFPSGFVPNIQNLVQVSKSHLKCDGIIHQYLFFVQILGAAMIPGNPQANMYFTLYGYNTLEQARGLVRDLKLVLHSFVVVKILQYSHFW